MGRNAGSTAGATQGRNRFLQHSCMSEIVHIRCSSSICTPLVENPKSWLKRTGLQKRASCKLQTVNVQTVAKSSAVKDPFGLSPSGQGGTGQLQLRRTPTSKFPLDLQPRQLPQSSSTTNTNNLQKTPANIHSYSFLRKLPTHSNFLYEPSRQDLCDTL